MSYVAWPTDQRTEYSQKRLMLTNEKNLHKKKNKTSTINSSRECGLQSERQTFRIINIVY